VWNFSQLWAARVWKCSKIIWILKQKSSMLRWSPYVQAKFGEVGSTNREKVLSVVTHPLKLHAKTCLIVDKSAVAYSISLNFVQSLNTWHPKCRRRSKEVKYQGHSLTWHVQKFAKLSIFQPGIAQFRSNFVQTLIMWRLMCHELSL